MAIEPMRRIKTWQDKIETDVAVFGSGPPLVYLHGPWGLRTDLDFVRLLADTRTVYAPKHPGTSDGDPDAVHEIDHWWDLIVYHGELFDRLGLGSNLGPVDLVGHSFGGMLGAEIAASMPERIRRLALIDPVGLWRDDHPVQNWMILSEAACAAALFADPGGEAARRFFAVPAEPAGRIDVLSQFIWAQACTGKFVWPLADRGLTRRIHRIAAPTLVVWGGADRIAAPVYADEFARRIAGAQIALIDGAGHLPHLEREERVVGAVTGFLG